MSVCLELTDQCLFLDKHYEILIWLPVAEGGGDMGEAEIGEEGEGLILPSQYYFHVLLFPQLDPPTRRYSPKVQQAKHHELQRLQLTC